MVEEITDEQVSLLEEKLEKLAELLTLRKIDWTHYSSVGIHTISLLNKSLDTNLKSYFAFELQKLALNKDEKISFVINVFASRNIGGMFFTILTSGQIKCYYSNDKFCEGSDFELPSDIMDRFAVPKIEFILEKLDDEIELQKQIISLLSK